MVQYPSHTLFYTIIVSFFSIMVIPLSLIISIIPIVVYSAYLFIKSFDEEDTFFLTDQFLIGVVFAAILGSIDATLMIICLVGVALYLLYIIQMEFTKLKSTIGGLRRELYQP